MGFLYLHNNLILILPFLTCASQPRQSYVMRRDEDNALLVDVANVRRAGDDFRSGLVLYSIQTAAENVGSINAALDTWAADLRPGQLQVVGMDERKVKRSHSIAWHKSDCPDSHKGGACKDFTALADAWDRGADWVVLLGSDNYAITSNIEAVLAKLSSITPHVLGIKGCGDCKAGGLCGGGGQIFSRGALKKMMVAGRESYMNESLAEAASCGNWGDVSNCRVAFAHGVSVSDLPGLHGWHLNVQELQDALSSTNPLPLTFHYLKPDEIKTLHALIAEHAESYFRTTFQAEEGLARWYEQREVYVAEERKRRRMLQ